MSQPVEIQFHPVDLEAIAAFAGRIALICDGDTPNSPAARRLNKLTRGAVARAMASTAWAEIKLGEALDLGFPAGLAAQAVQLVRLPRRTSVAEARKAGAAVARGLQSDGVLVLAEAHPLAAEVSFGLALRAYDFSRTRPCRPRSLAR